jgi:aspartate kinase
MDNYQFLHTGSYVKITLHNIPERPGVFSKMTKILADQNINILTIRHIAHSKEQGDIAFTVSKSSAELSIKLMQDNLKLIGATEISFKRDLALVFIWGEQIKNISRFASDILRAFSEYGVEFDSLSLAAEGVTCILHEHQLTPAKHAFNKMFVDEPIISPI